MRMKAVWVDGVGRLRTCWRMLLFAVVIAVTLLAIEVACALAAGVLPPRVRAALARQPLVWMLVIGPPVTAGSLGIVFLFRMLVDRRDVASIGLGRPRGGPLKSPLLGTALGLAGAGLPVLALVAAGALRVDGVGLSPAVLLAVPGLAFSAFCEELIFRGYLLRNMLDARRPALGVCITALLFALAHVRNPGFLDGPLGGLNVFLSGVALGLAYVAAGNLWFPTALHFGWNAAQGVVFGLSVSGFPAPGLLRTVPAEGADPLLTGGEFGLEGSVAATIASSILIGVLLLLVRAGARKESALTREPDSI